MITTYLTTSLVAEFFQQMFFLQVFKVKLLAGTVNFRNTGHSDKDKCGFHGNISQESRLYLLLDPNKERYQDTDV